MDKDYFIESMQEYRDDRCNPTIMNRLIIFCLMRNLLALQGGRDQGV